MRSVTADETILLQDLKGLLEPVEVYGPEGKLLGVFVPANLERGKEIQAWVKAHVDWSEIERRRQSNEPAAPFQDTLARLDRLRDEIDRRKATGEKEWTTDEALAYFSALPRQTVSMPSSPQGS